MSLEIYFRDCVEMRLNSIEEVAQSYPNGQYKEGFFACLKAVRISFNLTSALSIPTLEHKDLRLLECEQSVVIIEP